MTPSQIPFFERLTALQAHFPDTVLALSRMARESEEYQAELRLIEEYFRAAAGDKPQSTPDLTLESSKSLFAAAKKTPFVRQALLQEPRLSTIVPPEDIIELAKMADIRPAVEAKYIVTSRDGALVRAVQTLTERPGFSVEEFLNEDLLRIVKVYRLSPDLLSMFYEVSLHDDWESRQDWATQIRLIEDSFDPITPKSSSPPVLSREANALKQAITALKLPDEQLWKLLFFPPRFSGMLAEEFGTLGQLVLEVLVARGAQSSQDTEPDLENFLLEYSQNNRSPEPLKKSIDQISARWGMRIEISQQVLRLRQFAKQEALVRRWPELAKAIYEDDGRIIHELEQLATGNISSPSSEVQEIWETYRKTKPLLSLLRLQPLFSQSRRLSERAYRDAVSAVSRTTGPVEESKEEAKAATQHISDKEGEVSACLEVSICFSEEGSEYNIAVRTSDMQSPRQTKLSMGTADEVMNLWRAKKTPDQRMMGSMLYNTFFGGKLADVLPRAFDASKPLGSRRPVKVNLEMNSVQLARLPWECLYIPGIEDSWALIPENTINRYIAQLSNNSEPVLPLTSSVQVLAIFGEETEDTYTRVEQDILKRAVGTSDLFDLRVERATRIATITLREQLREFCPVILHVSRSTPPPDGNLIISSFSPVGNSDEELISQIADLIREFHIKIVIYHAYFGSQHSKVARQFLEAGAQCVVTTATKIEATVASRFTREFYQALAKGRNLERALVEARRALQAEALDWTPYVLYTSHRDISQLLISFQATIQTGTTSGGVQIGRDG